MNILSFLYRKIFPFTFTSFLKCIGKENISSVEITPVEGYGEDDLIPMHTSYAYVLEFFVRTDSGQVLTFKELVSQFTKVIPLLADNRNTDNRVKLMLRAQECKKELLLSSPSTKVVILDGNKKEMTDKYISEELQRIEQEKIVA